MATIQNMFKLSNRCQSVFGRITPKRGRFLASRPTIDQAEVSKFGNVSKDWWDPDGKSGVGPLHYINPARVQFIRENCVRHFHIEIPHVTYAPLDGLNILDVGCGGGILAESLARLGATVTAIDPSHENIAVAQAHAAGSDQTNGIQYRSASTDELVSNNETFDVVCALEVIEHVADKDLFLSDCAALTKPGGMVFLSTLNRTFKSLAMAVVAAEYILRILPPGTHDWKKFCHPHELTNGMRKFGVKCSKTSGIVLDPFQRRWVLDPQDLDVNFIWCGSRT